MSEWHEKRRKCIMYPHDGKKQAWDLFIGLILFAACVFIPYRLAFNLTKDYDSGDTIQDERADIETHQWIMINSTLDFFFIVDIVV